MEKYCTKVTIKAGVHFRNFSTDTKNNFSETGKYFPRTERERQIQFSQEKHGELKSYGKNVSNETNTL